MAIVRMESQLRCYHLTLSNTPTPNPTRTVRKETNDQQTMSSSASSESSHQNDLVCIYRLIPEPLVRVVETVECDVRR